MMKSNCLLTIAAVAIFAFVDAALIKPLPYANPTRLVGVTDPDALIALQQLLRYGQPWFATFNTVAVRKAMEDEVQAVLSGKKKPEAAVKDAQRKADEIMLPYVQSTALAVGIWPAPRP